ncbi:hypothetical protein IPG41_02375 [Candidatus Peregrinibacteria bacterium]|nr:MAG: hypothetical protein IPG41_02375 [Candidatus Peregrinibacteria bacterium]
MLALAFTFFAYSALARTLSRRLDESGSAALTIALLFTLMIVSVEGLGTFGLFSQNSLLVCSILALMGGFFLRPKDAPLPTNGKFFYLLLGLLATLPALIPSGETDSFGYHLPIVNQLLETGSVWNVFFAGFVGPNTYFPANHEALQAFLAAFTHNTEAGFLVNLSALALFFFSLKESLGTKAAPRFSALFVLAATCTPFLFKQIVNQQIDLFLFGVFGSALAFAASSFLNGKKVDFTKACLLLGLCLGSKYNALPQVLVLLPFLFALAIHQKHRLHDYAFNIGLTLTAGLFWYIRNAVIAGNPLYPFGISAGPIHWIGHSSFVQETEGSSLLSHLQSDGLHSTLRHVLSNGEFHNELGMTAVYLLTGTTVLLALKLFSRSHRTRMLSFALLAIAAGELLYYLSAPYTFTLWNQTIRYASPLFALVPVALMFCASTPKRQSFLGLFALVFIGSQLSSSFLSKDHVQTLLLDQFHAHPFLIFSPLLLAFTLSIFLTSKKTPQTTLFRLAIASLLVSLFTTTVVPQLKTPSGEASTLTEDAYLSVDLPGYKMLLPFLELLRPQPKGSIALTGLTPYALFEKEGFTAVYINTDGCLTCTYPDYRSKSASIRTAPNEAAWKAALATEDIAYLLVSTTYEPTIVMHEKTWADTDLEHFELLLQKGPLSLYRLR